MSFFTQWDVLRKNRPIGDPGFKLPPDCAGQLAAQLNEIGWRGNHLRVSLLFQQLVGQPLGPGAKTKSNQYFLIRLVLSNWNLSKLHFPGISVWFINRDG